MTQQDLDALASFSNDIRVATQVIKNAEECINVIMRRCDHRKPDGSPAILRCLYQFQVCEICGRDEEYERLWSD